MYTFEYYFYVLLLFMHLWTRYISFVECIVACSHSSNTTCL